MELLCLHKVVTPFLMLMQDKLKLLLAFMISLAASLPVNSQSTPDTVFNNLIRTENGGWVGGDATYSIFLPDGRTLWLFGDSFIGTVNADSSLAPGAKMIRNCAIIQNGDSMTALYQGTFDNPDDFLLTNTPDSTWFWPEHGIIENGYLKILFSEFGTGDGEPGWNFEYRKAVVAIFSFPDLVSMGYIELPYYQQNEVMYGDRLIEENGYTYIFGRKEEGNPDWHIPYIHMARVATGGLTTGEWEFYDGEQWTTDATASLRISEHPVSQQYGVFPHQGKYVLITQQIWLGTEIYSLTANSLEGPWENEVLLYDTPLPFPDMISYNSYPHPQFDEDNELLVSYNTNGDFWEIFNNIEIYRPRFIRVPYPLIDSSFTVLNTNENRITKEINCYPNPAKSTIHFSLNAEKNAPTIINIYDVDGQLMLHKDVDISGKNNFNIELNIEQLPSGIYFYMINNSRGKFIHN